MSSSRGFAAVLKNPYITIVCAALCAAALLFFTTLRVREASDPTRFLENSPTKAFFVPSPIEGFFLDQDQDIWPGLFSQSKLPSPERIPELHRAIEKSKQNVVFNASDLELSRLWSVFLYAKHTPVLLEVLPLQLKNEKSSCEWMHLEATFRLAQVDSSFVGTATEKLLACERSRVIGLSLKVLQALATSEFNDWPALSLELNALRNNTTLGPWSRELANQAFQLAHQAL